MVRLFLEEPDGRKKLFKTDAQTMAAFREAVESRLGVRVAELRLGPCFF